MKNKLRNIVRAEVFKTLKEYAYPGLGFSEGSESSKKKIYYHGRKMSRPYRGGHTSS